MSLKSLKICATKIYSNNIPVPTQKDDQKSIRAAFFTEKLWKQNSEITISFIGDPSRISLSTTTDKTEDPLQNQIQNMNYKDAIKKIVLERIQPLVNLKFTFLPDNSKSALVRIDFDPNRGSWSLVGTDCINNKDGATMNFGWFDVGTVLHEFGHLLGMIHEHQNPRGNKIKWNKNKVYQWAEDTQGWDKTETDNNILNAYNIDHINGSDFDPLSVMLYFFPSSLTLDGKGTNQNLRFSGIDVMWISEMYKNREGPSPELYYQQTYNQSLQSSIDESKKLSSLNSLKSSNLKYLFLKLLIFVIICFLIYLFVSKFLKK